MKLISNLLICAVFLALQACLRTPDFSDHVLGVAERLKGPKLEGEWNWRGLWYHVEGDIPTYLPVGFASDSPRTDKDGIWVVDERRSATKMVFVPYGGTENYSFGVLKGEAEKACDWTPRRTEWVRTQGGFLMP